MRSAGVAWMTLVLGIGSVVGIAEAAEEAPTPVDPEACKAAWSMASPNGDALVNGAPVPYVINFTMMDTDGDGKVNAEEFAAGCEKGLVKPGQTTAKGME